MYLNSDKNVYSNFPFRPNTTDQMNDLLVTVHLPNSLKTYCVLIQPEDKRVRLKKQFSDKRDVV